MTLITTRPAYVRRRSSFGDPVVKQGGYVSGLDDFPTPPWATRALFEYVAPHLSTRSGLRYLEPACGRGHMVMTLRRLPFIRSSCVKGSDVHDYDFGYRVVDYRTDAVSPYDVMITNPPFKLATEFAERALKEARVGVALLVRTLWAEGGRGGKKSRYARLFKDHPPTKIAIISGRMPAIGATVVRHRPVFVSHSWFWWDCAKRNNVTQFLWIPPEAQSLLERDGDYDASFLK
jgi:hypothetical protein